MVAAVVRVVVTGGGGFVGSAVISSLRARGDEVTSVARRDYPDLRAQGVHTIRADIRDTVAMCDAVDGADVLIHTAAKAGAWGSVESYRQANVVGTRSVLDACRARGVPRLVFTSSPSVAHSGNDLGGVDESVGYAKHFEAPYPQTKAEAERLVLAANSAELLTVALRPHLVWGPGDPHLVPRIVDRAREGRLALVGDGQNLIDATYIDNAALAHLNAIDALVRCAAPDTAPAGRAYFIAQGEPVPMRQLIDAILEAADLPPVTRQVPFPVAYGLGALLEVLDRFRPSADGPLMTRFLARQFSTAHWFDLTAARRDLGYIPTVSMAEGMARLKTFLRP